MVLQGDFTWDVEAAPAVSDMDLKVPKGSLVTIVGQTGSGKSSLLAAGLGLMNQVQGPAPQMHGKVRAAPPLPFLSLKGPYMRSLPVWFVRLS